MVESLTPNWDLCARVSHPKKVFDGFSGEIMVSVTDAFTPGDHAEVHQKAMPMIH